MSTDFLKDLRRIVDAVGQMRDRVVHDVTIRSDCRQLRITLDDGQILLVSVLMDETDKPRLDIDLLRAGDGGIPTPQLEVRFDGGE